MLTNGKHHPEATAPHPSSHITENALGRAEYDEMQALGMITQEGTRTPASVRDASRTLDIIERHAMHATGVLNEAFDYAKPSSFSRGIRFDLGDKTVLLISGTASIDEAGRTVNVGDFRAQLWRTYRNISELLAADGASWHDIVRTSCYLRDIERDYKDFNEVRTEFFEWLGLDPLPASTGIQTRLCREDLLIEIEAIAVMPRDRRR